MRALAAMVAELQVQRVTPARLEAALRAWAAADGARRVGRREELGRCFGEYRRVLERIGRTRPRAAALRKRWTRCGASLRCGVRRRCCMYGFDDLGALQLDAIETLGTVVGAPVTVSLAYEPGRAAFAGRAGTFQALAPLAAEHRRLPARAEYYAPAARAALHHLERSLFEPGAARVDSGGAVRLLEGGGERAELELVAGEIAAAAGAGHGGRRRSRCVRAPAGAAAELLEEVFGDAGHPLCAAAPRAVRGHRDRPAR